MSINFNHLVIEGVSYLHVLKLEINQAVNTHARAEVIFTVDIQTGKNYMEEVQELEAVSIGIPEVIFIGVIKNAKIQYEDTYATIVLKLISTSSLWDVQRLNRSYQIIGDSYSTIMNKATNGNGIIEFQGNDKTSETMIVQYKETIWEFILRLAAECGEVVYVDPASRVPHVFIGSAGQSGSYSGNVTGTEAFSGNAEQYVPLTGKINGRTISSSSTVMQNGQLVSSYESKELSSLLSNQKPKYGGRVMAGTVMGVKKDQIQVHITDLDAEFDEGSNTWFPYSTAYSSESNHSGIYCMPIEGDCVRVFFPSEDLSQVFASSSNTMRGLLEDYEEKCFQTPQGMRVLFMKDGLHLMCNNKLIVIELLKDGRVNFYSETSIEVHAAGNVEFSASEGNIKIESGNNICMATGNSLISIKKNDITMVSDRIMTQ